jgi:DnaJ-class molecular chaperone
VQKPNWLRDIIEGVREGLEQAEEDKRARQVVQMPLDWPCTTCSGRGTNTDRDPCTRCDGSGFALSPRGQELIEFLTRHGFAQNLM